MKSGWQVLSAGFLCFFEKIQKRCLTKVGKGGIISELSGDSDVVS